MKKLTAGLITSALVIVLGSTTALAVGNGRQTGAGNGLNAGSQYSAGCTGTFCESTGYYFTDEDGDGICDHRGTRPDARYTQTCPYCQNDPENCPRHTATAGDSIDADTPAVDAPAASDSADAPAVSAGPDTSDDASASYPGAGLGLQYGSRAGNGPGNGYGNGTGNGADNGAGYGYGNNSGQNHHGQCPHNCRQ